MLRLATVAFLSIVCGNTDVPVISASKDIVMRPADAVCTTRALLRVATVVLAVDGIATCYSVRCFIAQWKAHRSIPRVSLYYRSWIWLFDRPDLRPSSRLFDDEVQL